MKGQAVEQGADPTSAASPAVADCCFRSPSPDATRTLARALGTAVGADGCVLALEGDLGTGKTVFVKGLAAGLGLDPDSIASPTFVIAIEHARPTGRALVHFDLYRLERAGELESAGLDDALVAGNVVAIEWADRFPAVLPADRLVVRIERDPASGADARRIRVSARGERSRALLARWREALPQEDGFRWH